MVDVVGGIYDAGKVSVVNGSKSVTGTGTFWLAIGENLDEIWIGDRNALVAQFNSDAELELALPWSGETLTDVDYVLNLRSPLRYDPAITQAKVRDLIAFYTLGGVRGTRTVVNATDAITVDDREKVIKYNRATAIAVTLPAAGANGQFVDGWAAWLKNSGAGAVSITSTSLIDGSSDPYVIPEGAAVRLWANDQGGYDVIFYSNVGGVAIGAAGELSGRDAFDGENPGFTYFATDTELLYIRLSAGGWSAGSVFRGETGPAATIEFDEVVTLPPGSAATATNSGTPNAAVLTLGIPAGVKGDAATISPGSVTALPFGSDPTVTNSGTTKDAVFDFGIPAGPQGLQGNAFTPNEIEPDLAGRAAWDGEAKNFAVLVESDSSNDDLPTLYFKKSNTSGDWSNGFTFTGGAGGGGDVAEPVTMVTDAAATIEVGAVTIAVSRTSPTQTILSLPSVADQTDPIKIVDWSDAVTGHEIQLGPAGTETVMKQTSFSIRSNASQLAGVKLYPSTTLNGWIIAP